MKLHFRNVIYVALTALSISLFGISVASSQNSTPCMTESGFGEFGGLGEYKLDLLCQPVFTEIFEIEPGNTITVSVDMSSYYAVTGKNEAEFIIHLAMDRAWIKLTEVGTMNSMEVTDSGAALEDIELTTDEEMYTFTIENLGFRSAVFDLIVRPQS